MTIFYTCPECENEFEVEVSPLIPGKTWGPPESCYPDEGGEVEPDSCPGCGKKWDTDKIYEIAAEKDEPDYPEP